MFCKTKIWEKKNKKDIPKKKSNFRPAITTSASKGWRKYWKFNFKNDKNFTQGGNCLDDDCCCCLLVDTVVVVVVVVVCLIAEVDDESAVDEDVVDVVRFDDDKLPVDLFNVRSIKQSLCVILRKKRTIVSNFLLPEEWMTVEPLEVDRDKAPGTVTTANSTTSIKLIKCFDCLFDTKYDKEIGFLPEQKFEGNNPTLLFSIVRTKKKEK